MRGAGQIVQHAIGSAEGRLGVDHPFPAAERSQISGEAGRDGQVLQLAVEAQFTGRMDLLQGTEVDLSEAAGQYAYGEEEATTTAGHPTASVRRDSATRHDPVQMGGV